MNIPTEWFLILSAILFAIGLLSEQVASLRFDRSEED